MIPLFQLNRSKVNNAGTIFDQDYARSLLKAEAYIGSWWHVAFLILCTIFVIYTITKLVNELKIKERALYFILYFYHMLLGSVFFYLSKNDLMLADSRSYYYKVLAPDVVVAFDAKFEPSTNFIVWITDILVYDFHLNYLCCTYLFATLGFYGFIYFLRTAIFLGANKSITFGGVFIFPLLLFLPNIHFWTTILGKDSLIFYAIMGFTFALTNVKKHWFLFVFMGFLFFMVRPHIFIFALLALLITLLVFAKIPGFLKLSSFTILAIGSYNVIIYFLSEFMSLKNIDIELVLNLLDSNQSTYSEGSKFASGSAISMKGVPIPFQMFTYLYRPFFERASVNFLFLSFENLAMFLLSLPLFSRKFYSYLIKSPFVSKFSFIYALIGVGFMGYVNSNLGISTRQKTMFIFSLLLPILGYLAYRAKIALEKSKSAKIEAIKLD